MPYEKGNFYLIGIILLLSSCVKQDVGSTANVPVIVRLSYINEITGVNISMSNLPDTTIISYDYKTMNVFSVLTFGRCTGMNYLAGTIFEYDSLGRVSSTSYTDDGLTDEPASEIRTSAITYLGNDITIKFYQNNGLLNSTFTLTYDNNQLKEVFNPNLEKITYTYDTNGNNTKEVNETYANGVPTGRLTVLTNTTFDESINFTHIFPLWVYFKCYTAVQLGLTHGHQLAVDNIASIMNQSPGAHNPYSFSIDGGPLRYHFHTTNPEGYPDTMTLPGEYINQFYYYTPLN